jgi:O-antigen/teichoic acid export membrane protein
MTSYSEGYQRRTSALQVVSSISTAVALFAVFRFTGQLLSVKWIGAWSLIQGLFLIARVSDSGAGANISRVAAVRLKEGTNLELRSLTFASLIIASLPSVFLSMVSAPLIGLYVTAQFGDELDRDGLWALVWLALLCAALAATSNILLAICEGLFQLNFKSIVVISGNAAGLVALLPLIALAGPAGVGWTYVVIFGTQLAFSLARVTKMVRADSSGQPSTIRQHIRLLWRENLDLSGIALIRLSFEPATKLLLSFFAPLVVIAQFELALRVTTQIRVVIQSALQPLLVLGARADDGIHAGMREIFLKNDRVLSTLSFGAVVAQILAAPAILLLGMGSYYPTFIAFFVILVIGNAINIMGLSGYYWQLASGSLTPLVRVQALMAGTNICIGLLGLVLGSPLLVVASYSIAFAYGGWASRSFLPDVPLVTRILSSCLVVACGLLFSGVALLAQPKTVISVSILLCCAAAVGAISLYAALKTSRRKGH